MARRSWGHGFFAVLVGLTIVIGIVAYVVVENGVNVVVDAYQARRNLTLIFADVVDQETGVRGYAATKRPIFLEPYRAALARYPGDKAEAIESSRRPQLSAIVADIREIDGIYVVWQRTVNVPLVTNPAARDADLIALLGKNLVDRMRARTAHATAIANVAIAAAVRRTRIAIVASIGSIVVLTVILGAAGIDAERKRTLQERSLRAEIAARNEALERSNQSLEEFAYVASHDLQEPLRTVASFTQLLQRRYAGRLDAEADEFIAFAVDGATRMQQLIADILQYSRVTTHGKPLVPVDLNAPVARAIQNLEASIRERSAEVDVPALPVVAGDASQLMQLFQNLIGNALKYNRSSPPRVTVKAERRGDEWVFAVADNGIGIAPEYHERIFRIFSRLHTRSEYGGTGIGLALCRRIVERHHGRIWVESVEGAGAVFSFTLRAAEKRSE